MSKFKVGDKVRLIETPFGKFTMGYEGFVTELTGTHTFKVDGATGCVDIYWELVPLTEEEKAKKTLEALGYTITPPKPKRSIEVIMYDTPNGECGVTRKEFYESWVESSKKTFPIIAITTITEGEGI